jgi:hypothetical protein
MQEMKHLKTYQLFESRTGLTKGQENFLNRYTKGTWSYNPATGLVDVKGDFNCSGKGTIKTFRGVKFGRVSGRFNCEYNKLTSLEGAPQKVGGRFDCRENKLTSLKGAPQEVGGHFYCSDNELTSLEGSPQEVGGRFDCETNKLTSLAGAPQKVGGVFWCSDNQLTSLEGAPQEVGGNFYCYNNKLTSLEGAPQEVGGDFECDAFELKEGDWNLKGWLKLLREGSPEEQKLILTLVPAEELNKEIQKDPAGMIMKLKDIWNDEGFKEIRDKLVWPKGYEQEADLVGDLDDVGF